MHLQESGEMYLETILVLSQKMPAVRAIDIGEYMGYSKPSVSRAMGLLKKGALICVDRDGYITLTDDGRAVAEKIYSRHTLLKDFLSSIGIPEEIAAEDACKMEHYISDTTFNAIKNHMSRFQNFLKTDFRSADSRSDSALRLFYIYL